MKRVSCGTPYLQAGELSLSVNEGKVSCNVDVAAIPVKILVSDIEKTLSFYRDVLGLKVVTHRRLESEKICLLANEEGVHLQATILSLGDEVFGTAALIEFIGAGGQPFYPFKNKSDRLIERPFAKFSTNRIEKVFAKVQQTKVDMIYPQVFPYTSTDRETRPREFMFRDGEGVLVKITEVCSIS